MTDQLSEELDYSQAVVKPLLACLQAQSKRAAEVAPGAAAGGAAAEPLRLVLSNVHLACSIFYSLNSPGLTDVRRGRGGRQGRMLWGACARGCEGTAAARCKARPRRCPCLHTVRGRRPSRPPSVLRLPPPLLPLQAFEDTLDAWMAEFHTFLTLDAPALAEADPEKESVVDGVKAQVGRALRCAAGLRVLTSATSTCKSSVVVLPACVPADQ